MSPIIRALVLVLYGLLALVLMLSGAAAVLTMAVAFVSFRSPGLDRRYEYLRLGLANVALFFVFATGFAFATKWAVRKGVIQLHRGSGVGNKTKP